MQIRYKDIIVRSESERSQHLNKALAFSLLKAKIYEAESNQEHEKMNKKRKDQIGSGMRGDKIRTIRVFDNQVKSHLRKRKMSFERYEKGFIEEIQ